MRIKKFNKKVTKTSQDKAVKPRFIKKDYVAMLSDASKFPLSMRIAAELFRGSVTSRRFEDEFHIDGNSFSMQIYHHIVNFDLSKGADPEKIPPILPVFLRYLGGEQIQALKAKEAKGRPSSEEALLYLRKLLDDRLKAGWHEVDFINALRDLVDTDTKPIAKIVLEDDMPDEVAAKKVERVYHARISDKWQRFTSQKSASDAMLADNEAVLGPVEIPTDRVHCIFCHTRLKGAVMTIRDKKKARHMHPGCYWMREVPAAQVQLGMEVLNPVDGLRYTFNGLDKGGWKPKEINETKTPSANPQGGVPEPERETSVAPAAVSNAAPPRK